MEDTNHLTNRPAPGNDRPAPLPIVGISAGDPNGVGYEIIIKGLSDPHILEICRPIIYGNLNVLRTHQKALGDDWQKLQPTLIKSAQDIQKGKVCIINCYSDSLPLSIGKSTKDGGMASYASLKRACDDLEAGHVDALVTAPINKENIQSDDFKFSGHTEYLTQRFAEPGKDSLMMMVSDQMKVALVCNHVAIAKVPSFISQDRILRKLHTLEQTLTADFALRKPRIAVLALNPHSGDNGLIGSEEQTTIEPAIKQAREEGILAFGPYSADGFFGSGKYAQFDAILAMYHDQGLIPFKSLDMDGVNYTAGLHIIRTSPDHGTAYDLAGKDQASFESFVHALCMAVDLKKRREQYKELTADVLPIKEPQPEKRERKEFKGFNPAEAKREREERIAAERAARQQGNAN